MDDLISRKRALEEMTFSSGIEQDGVLYVPLRDVDKHLKSMPSVQPEKEIPKRVRWSGWKGTRYTRYYCPNCEKPVRNDDYYCHRCGQRLTFPKVTFTNYVPGKKQQTIITWEDEDE